MLVEFLSLITFKKRALVAGTGVVSLEERRLGGAVFEQLKGRQVKKD